LALDGQKRPCRVRTSNAGHALFAVLAAPERAQRVAAGLLDKDFFAGWGIRTVGAQEARYNPMSYHNGSVWPPDNAAIGPGFAPYGVKAERQRAFLRAVLGGTAPRGRAPRARLPSRRGPGRRLPRLAFSPPAWV